MPTYEFRLPDGTIIERTFRMSEVPDEIPNPTGEGAAVRIISGGAALVFKGSGFYLTDYGKNAHRTQGDAPKPGGSPEAKSESGTTAAEPGGAKADAAPSATKESKTSESKSSESKPAESKPSSPSDSKSSGSGPAAS